MKKKILSTLLSITMVILMVGCSSGGNQEQATHTEAVVEKNTESSENSGDKTSSDKAYKVGITIQTLDNSYWAGVFSEVEKELKARGIDGTILSSNDDSSTQIQQIEQFTNNNMDLIMVHPSDPSAIEDYLKIARDKGIKVMSWDDKLTNSDLNWVLNNQELGYSIGSTAAEFINEHFTTESPAEVAILNYPQTPVLLERENGILDALEKEAAGKYKVVAQQPAIDAQAGMDNMETIFQANPNVKVVCCVSGSGDIGANEAFKIKYNNEIPDDVGIFSADGTKQELEAIMNGEATRAAVGFEGSDKRTAIAVVDMYEKLLKGEDLTDQDVYRPLLVLDINNASEYLADYNN